MISLGNLVDECTFDLLYARTLVTLVKFANVCIYGMTTIKQSENWRPALATKLN